MYVCSCIHCMYTFWKQIRFQYMYFQSITIKAYNDLNGTILDYLGELFCLDNSSTFRQFVVSYCVDVNKCYNSLGCLKQKLKKNVSCLFETIFSHL